MFSFFFQNKKVVKTIPAFKPVKGRAGGDEVSPESSSSPEKASKPSDDNGRNDRNTSS